MSLSYNLKAVQQLISLSGEQLEVDSRDRQRDATSQHLRPRLLTTQTELTLSSSITKHNPGSRPTTTNRPMQERAGEDRSGK